MNNRYLYTPEKSPLEKALSYIEQTQEKLGWLVISVYRFPVIEGFGTFLESVQRCLNRHGLFSWYLWSRNNAANQYLLIHLGHGLWAGHFEAECAAIIPRLWRRHSHEPFVIFDTVLFDENNKHNLRDFLEYFLTAIGSVPPADPGIPMNFWHQRSFSTAQIPFLRQKNPPARGDWPSAA